MKAGVSDGFVDVGPEVSWHGLTRPSSADVAAAGGTVAAALPKVGLAGLLMGDGRSVAFSGGFKGP